MADIGIADMKPGDVLLFQDVTGAATHFGIAAAQAIFSHRFHASSNVTHVGLYDGAGGILEASGQAGLRVMGLAYKARGSKYQVYRLTIFQIQGLPQCAVAWAKRLAERRPDDIKNPEHKGEGFGRYDTRNAVKSLFSMSNRGRRAKAAEVELTDKPDADRGFYCSNFVAECYLLACRDFRCKPSIDADFRQLTPKLLQATLRKSSVWEHVGDYVVPRPPN